MSKEPSIALVLLNYNGHEYLRRNLPFLKNTSYKNKKIYVIDNNSQDDSRNYLQLHHPDIIVVPNSKNLGYAGGYNAGLSVIEADYYCLLNTDVEVTEHFIEPIILAMEKDEHLGICQPKILSLSKRTFFEYAGAAGGWIDKLGYTFTRGRIFDSDEEDIGQYNTNCEIFWASGACMFIRSSLFKKLNGFYEYFFMYSEEVDFCWRGIAVGYSVGYCGESSVYHRDTHSLMHQSPKRLYYVFRNSLITLHRNLPASSAIWIIPTRIFLNLLAIFYFVGKGHLRISIATARAQAAYLKWALVREGKVSGHRKVSLSGIRSVYNGSIVYKYFILRKTKFSDIVKF